tara:strand:- start:196 stop:408 length:213 start_codon:yes stop_codon:yes gene_type:complete
MLKIKDKKLKKLMSAKDYLDRKVSELTKDRKNDRSWDAKATLLRLKKQKLKLKEQISKLADKFSKFTKVK